MTENGKQNDKNCGKRWVDGYWVMKKETTRITDVNPVKLAIFSAPTASLNTAFCYCAPL